MNEMLECTHCGELFDSEDLTDMGDQCLCPSCLEAETLLCICCGDRLLRNQNQGSDDTPLCEDCRDRHYTVCERCGELIHVDDVFQDTYDGDDLCYSCNEGRRRDQVIRSYDHKPSPIFYGEGPRFFGIELELDRGGEENWRAAEILNEANSDGRDLLYAKHDGSLSDGFEIVSHPMSLAFHTRDMPWEAVLERAKELGYRSHQTDTCGLHIHVSRAAFGEDEEEQESAISRILYLVERHWEEWLTFSRRTSSQLKRWAARYGFKEQPKDILDHAKTRYSPGRYSCINLENEDTIEFRIFRGTLKKNTLIATLQMVNYVCDLALFLTDEEIKAMSWPEFVSGCTQPELVQYLKERRLYVNDPICGAEEV